MKAIILAGGFATRLYSLTKNKAKPLLEVKGKKIIDYIIEKIKKIKNINEIIIITNNKFYKDFLEWKKTQKSNIKVLNDGIDFEEEKLGAIGDLFFAIKKEKINEEILIIAGDSLFKFSLEEIYPIFKRENKDLAVFHDIKDFEKAKRFGVAVTKDNLIIDFEEKPEDPKSTLCSVAIYFYKKSTLDMIRKFNEEVENKDQLGLFLKWLYKKTPIYAYITREEWIDIGTKESLEQAKKFM